ncbi:MAG: hypothetical protein FWD60_04695 [Candidatus Azobacteroides sp.]|nr:hypothetical protein [Candidatus Azobacteroides sp.]
MIAYDIQVFLRLIKLAYAGVLSYFASLISPVHDFIVVLIALATLNIIFGLIEDWFNWNFLKAFKSFIYIGGYLFLLLLAVFVTEMMKVKQSDITDITAWITWVMIWFYSTNILRNWTLIQPENKVIAFIYWVVSFKMIEKIKWLKEYIDKRKDEPNADINGD